MSAAGGEPGTETAQRDGEFVETAPPAATDQPPVQREPFNPSRYRERARALLAVGLTLLLAAVLLAIVIALMLFAWLR